MAAQIKLKKKQKARVNSGVKQLSDLLTRDISFKKKRQKLQFFEAFYKELNALTASGLSVVESLELILENIKSTEQRLIVKAIINQLIQGKELSYALKCVDVFSAYDINSVRIGEQTGSLNNVLADLSNYYTSRIKLKKEIVSALSYPVLVLVVAFGVILFMLNFLVPMFEDVFNRMGGDLPRITRLMIDVSVFFRSNSILLLFLILALFLTILYFRKYKKFRRLSSLTLLKLPVIGALLRLIYLGRFSRAMYLLLHAKVPLLESLNLVSQMISFVPLNDSIKDAMNQIESGGVLSEGFEGSILFDKRIIALIKVAEQSNNLSLVFNRIAEQYSEELSYRSKLLRELIEPIIIIVLGLVVAIILVAMYLPIFNMNTGL